MTNKKDDLMILPYLVALANLGLFGLLFGAMWFFELMGADPDYFDKGTLQNLQYINLVSSKFGFHIDPAQDPHVSTLGFSICLGLALVSSWFCIVMANRKSLDQVETTDLATGA
jgi:hypothetical protein